MSMDLKRHGNPWLRALAEEHAGKESTASGNTEPLGEAPPNVFSGVAQSTRAPSLMSTMTNDEKAKANGSTPDPAADLLSFVGDRRFKTVLADPPWRFTNRTGKVAPEHRRLSRYGTMRVEQIAALPVAQIVGPTAHLYLWVPNALLPQGLEVLDAWGFSYKSNIVWHKLRKDGGSGGRGVGFYFRNVTELILFGVRGKNARTLAPGRRQVNYLGTRKREHSRKPDEQYEIIEACSPGPYLELFARGARPKWTLWGDQADDSYKPSWKTYAHNSANGRSYEKRRRRLELNDLFGNTDQ